MRRGEKALIAGRNRCSDSSRLQGQSGPTLAGRDETTKRRRREQQQRRRMEALRFAFSPVALPSSLSLFFSFVFVFVLAPCAAHPLCTAKRKRASSLFARFSLTAFSSLPAALSLPL